MTLLITGADRRTTDIITYIAEKSGAKVVNDKKTKLPEMDENRLELKKQFDKIIDNIKKKHNAIAKDKIK